MNEQKKSLTSVERLQLINQYQILEKLDQQNADYYAKCREIVEHGYTYFYEELFNPLFEEISEEACNYVVDVLDLYRDLKQSYEALADKGGIDEKELEFPGFDGNNESRYLSFTRYLQKDGRFVESLGGDRELNCHFPTTSKYRRMLETREGIGDTEKFGHLTADEIKRIVNPVRRRRNNDDFSEPVAGGEHGWMA